MFKIIKGTDDPLEYSHEELLNSLKSGDEFTSKRIEKELRKMENKIINILSSPTKKLKK